MNRITVVSVLALWLVIAPSSLFAEPAISSCTIDAYLTGKTSPLSGNGLAFVENGLKYWLMRDSL